MSTARTQLAERRRRLVAQAADQRTLLGQNLAPWRARLARVDQGVAVLRSVGRPAVLVIGGALVLAVLRPRRVFTWLHRGWLLWQLGRRLRAR